jgi:methyl-accepting chemotaxis protein
MFTKLATKLLLPIIAVGAVFILTALLMIDNLSKYNVIGFVFFMVAVQLIASYVYFNSAITGRLANLSNYLDMVVNTEQAPSSPLKDSANDDLASITNNLSGFIVGLADVVEDIRRESEILRQGSTELSTQMNSSLSSVDESTQQVEQMAQAIEEIAKTSSTLASSAEQVSETTSSVMNTLSEGVNSSNTSQKTIEAVASEVDSTAQELTLLQEESARIGSVLDVIRGIAEQTNLLALNAAIEAARAGDQGRGFAVVADEVRALAHRTQESTVEIQSMVEGLQEKSTNAVSAINRGQKLTQDSLSHSAQVVTAIDKVGIAFQEVDNLTSQIASGTQDQQNATSSINDSMMSVVSLGRDINQGLLSVTEHAEIQQKTSMEVKETLNRICV